MRGWSGILVFPWPLRLQIVPLGGWDICRAAALSTGGNRWLDRPLRLQDSEKKEKEMRMRTIGARGDKWGEINDWFGDDELNFIDGWGDVYDRRHLWKKWPGKQYFMPGLRKNTWSHAIINLLLICQSCREMKITLDRRIFIILIELLFN